MAFDLEEQQEPEQFSVEQDDKPSKEVRKLIREQKKKEKANKKVEEKHRAKFTRVNHQNCYICDNCGKAYKEEEGTLMYNMSGEYAYCKECLKLLYPNYKICRLAGTHKKTDLLSNHADTQYFSGIY